MNARKPSRPRVALFEPRIPQNTGTIGRSCLAFNLSLDIIKPTGFSFDDKYLKRAGLDYWQYLKLLVHSDYKHFQNSINNSRLIGFSKNGNILLSEIDFYTDDILLFGPEDTGLSQEVRNDCNYIVEIPMIKKANDKGLNGVRSLNLSVACGIASYMALDNIAKQIK